MKIPSRILCLVLCAALALSLGGCRYSSVLEQIIYDKLRSQQVDSDPPFQLEENNPENEETSDDLKDLETDPDAQRVTEESPEPSQTAEDNAAASQSVSSDTQTSSDTTQQGTTASSVPAETDEGTVQPDSGDNGTGAGGTGESGTDYEANAGADTVKQVVDAYGKTVDIPADVDQVAATGQLALMTLILGGADRLAACSEELGADGYSGAAIFQGLDQVERLWSADGSTALDEAGFQRLLELAPDVVLEFSGSTTVTSEQAERLSQAGIAYLVLPAPISLANVNTAMTTLGTVLGDRSDQGGTNAPQLAASYVAWTESVYAEVFRATEAYAAYSDDDSGISRSATYTLYLDGWDSQASYRLYSERFTTLSGTGCAVVRNGATDSCRAVSNFLSYAHVVNTAAQYGITKKALYFTPLISAYRTMEVTGTMADGMVTAGQKLLEVNGASLGTDYFPILLVADAATAQGVASSELWQVYPHINSGDGSFNSDGFLDEEGNLVRTQISGEYEIVVNPRGLTNWAEGGCEGILESVWAAWRFFGALSEDEVRGYIRDFYNTFYGLSLSESQLDAILEGDSGT